MKLKILIIGLVFGTHAMAGILVDPYVGYRTGSFEVTSENTTYEFDLSGYGYGLRLGYNFLGLMAGVEYGLGSVDREYTRTGSEETYDTTQMSAFIGYNFPLVRFWGSYYWNYKLEIPETNLTTGDYEGDKWEGNGFGLGIGFTGIPFISINLEYKRIEIEELTYYSSSRGATRTVNYPTSDTTKPEIDEFFLSVSVPFDF
ncbi:MAG: outer membrane beta-barrel protein [Bacteriovoracaceae bacterium]|nr:outer membrane beta-barrel protein [Bacteriovoracaceae bacterium]